jgi:hypothetical protein
MRKTLVYLLIIFGLFIAHSIGEVQIKQHYVQVMTQWVQELNDILRDFQKLHSNDRR